MITIIKGNIVDMAVDAIVNAANESMRGGGGVDGAIHHAAGPDLVKETVKYAPLYVGRAVATNAYNLDAKSIIHVVGPMWNGGASGEYLALETCYRNAVELANKMEYSSIAFPSISTGVYGFPVDRAAMVAVQTLCEMASKYPEMAIFMVCFTNEIKETYELELYSYLTKNKVTV
jgi:O-acetyl-ADP-ribose deacetylase (regulator of RNase III)